MAYTPTPFPIPTVPPEFTAASAPEQSRKFAAQLYQDFFNFPIIQDRNILETTSAEDWERAGQKMALEVFHAAAERVPAYKDFLRKNKIDPEKIQTIETFKEVPATDKKDYIKNYSLEDLSWDGNFHRSEIAAVSSGSTGKAFLWPRETRLEIEATYFFELVLDSFFAISQYKTLIVDCFAMGMYVGGPFFLNATLRTAQKGYPATVVTPGNVMDDIIRVVQEFSPYFEQIILSGYPPFLKDVIENGEDAGIEWSKYRTIIFPAGEGFSESWRAAVAKIAGITNPQTNFLSYYGTADAAVLGVETPWSVAVRQAISTDNGSVKKVFGQSRLPSFMQYLPTMRYFECVNNDLHFTTASGAIPLIRYNIGDDGGIKTPDEVAAIAHEVGLDITKKFPSAWQLPYVYVFGRSDHTAILYGANIYPENIKSALETGNIANKCTGRFIMETEEDHHHNQHLSIHVECAKGVRLTNQLRRRVATTITLQQRQ